MTSEFGGDDSRAISRRDALKVAAGAAAVAIFSTAGTRISAAGGGKSVVVIARNAGVWKGDSINAEKARSMLMNAVRKLAGTTDDKKAWSAFFRPGQTVGVKLNCLAGKPLSPKPELIRALCDGITRAGVRESDIILWDQTDRDLKKAGFKIDTSNRGVRCFGSDNGVRESGYDDDVTVKGAVGCKVSRIASRTCDVLVNAGVLKHHDLAGVSISLKNYYGAIHNPNKYHADNCNPYIADVYSFNTLGGKTSLVVCDATLAQYEGGPGYKKKWAWKHNAIMVSTDPVALDAVGRAIIEEKRKAAGLPSLAAAGVKPAHIESAAARGLGTADLKKIKVIEIS